MTNTLEDRKTAKDIIQALLKAKKNIRLYPENNPLYVKIIDDIFLIFEDFFKYEDELILKIKQNEIFSGSEQVYHNPQKDNNIALFFFKDGLREITFKKALSKEELEDFLKIIALDFDREAADDDIVTLLWERDFPNIKYIADESFLMEEEDYESKATAEMQNKAPAVDSFQKAYSDALKSADVKDIPIINLTDADLQLLIEEKAKDQKDKTKKIFTIISEMLFQTESTVEFEDVCRSMEAVVIYPLRNGNFKTFLDIIKKLRGMTENPSVPDNIKKQINLILSVVSSEESIKLVSPLLASDATIDEDVLIEYTGFLNKNAIAPLITVLGELEGIQGRKKVINILLRLGKTDMAALSKGLKDPQWYVVKDIVHILRHTGDKKAIEYILTAAKHPDIRVRKEIVTSLDEAKSPAGLQVLRDYLNDTDMLIRKAAVKALGSIGSETARGIIFEKISEKDFIKKDFDEKKEFFAVLSNWNDTETVNFILKILRKKSLFKKSSYHESTICAAYSLGLLGNKNALPDLYKLKKSKNRLIRENVDAAIRKIEDAG